MRFMILLLALLGASLFAESAFQIELGMKGILKPGTHSPGLEMTRGAWRKAGKNTRLIIRGYALPEWKKYSFSFIPVRNGITELTLKSASGLAVFYDDLSMTGASLLNGGFETLRTDRRTPVGWGASYGTMTAESPLSGDFCLAVSGKQYAVQSLHVAAGKEVKLEFYVRSKKYTKGDQNDQ